MAHRNSTAIKTGPSLGSKIQMPQHLARVAIAQPRRAFGRAGQFGQAMQANFKGLD
jgi:hypothetical protein